MASLWKPPPSQPETHAEKVLVRRVGSGLGTTLPRSGDGERFRALWVSSSPTEAWWVGSCGGGGVSDDMADLERQGALTPCKGGPRGILPPHQRLCCLRLSPLTVEYRLQLTQCGGHSHVPINTLA